MIMAILLGVVVMVLNVLDSVTTYLCFKQYPDKTLKGEGNPMMRALMLKSKSLAEVVKQGVVLALVILSVISIVQIEALKIFSILLGLVVINNSWVVASRAIAKRKVMTPFERSRVFLHFPEKYYYIVAVAILVGLAYLINAILW